MQEVLRHFLLLVSGLPSPFFAGARRPRRDLIGRGGTRKSIPRLGRAPQEPRRRQQRHGARETEVDHHMLASSRPKAAPPLDVPVHNDSKPENWD